MSSGPRYVGVARPPQGVDPHPSRLVVNLTGPSRSTVDDPPCPDPPPSLDPPPSHDPPPSLDPPAEPDTRPWVRATVAAEQIQPVRYGRFSEHRRRIRRRVLRRFELAAWICAVVVVAGLALVVVRGLHRAPVLAAVRPAATAPASAGEDAPGVPGPGSTSPVVDCAFNACPTAKYSGSPTRVRIQAIGVDSSLEALGLDAQNRLVPPKDYQRAGWFSGGVAPGDTGAAIIAGHVDSRNGPGVFFELHTLRAGDLVEVDRGGQTVTFRVTGTEQYPKNAFPADRVYSPTPGPELRLITCGGLFDPSRGSYRDNIVVYAIAT